MEGTRNGSPGAGAATRPGFSRRGPLATTMVAGIGVTIVLWLAAGVDLIWRFERVNREVGALTDRMLRAEQDLEAIRTSILLGAIDWRDALLDGGGSAIATPYLARLAQHRDTSAASLASLRSAGEPIAASGALAELAREVEEYWGSILPIISFAPTLRPGDITRLMRERVIPRRAIVERIVARVQTMNRLQLQQQSRREVDMYSQSRTRFLVTGSLALLASFGVGALVTLYVGRLEQALRAQLAANSRNAADLHRLSGRLVRAQEDERRLIARELHDEVGQALTAVKMQLTVAGRAVPPDQAGAIDEARRVADAALQSARQLSRLLHPPMLDDLGLVPALESYLTAFGERTGIATELFHAGMEHRPAPAAEICLFRIVQEATTNIARHASASSCRVRLRRTPSTVVLTVEDDGRGFEHPPGRFESDDGLGLIGMQERVADARGTFRLDSTPGRGTRLSVELPAATPPDAAPSGAPEALPGPSEED